MEDGGIGILWPFDLSLFCFGILYQEQSGNTVCEGLSKET
jgi:hypothetical protein